MHTHLIKLSSGALLPVVVEMMKSGKILACLLQFLVELKGVLIVFTFTEFEFEGMTELTIKTVTIV